jgi:hypothetical protein
MEKAGSVNAAEDKNRGSSFTPFLHHTLIHVRFDSLMMERFELLLQMRYGGLIAEP